MFKIPVEYSWQSRSDWATRDPVSQITGTHVLYAETQ